jgi:catechol 2,3-dioxygenase-like lactoylglutathione lyase family enzyme
VTDDTAGFPDADAGVDPLLVVRDLAMSLDFWVRRVGARPLVQWDTYALLQLGNGRVHLAVTGDPPVDRAVRLIPPDGPGDTAAAVVVIRVGDCRAVVAALERRGVRFLGPPATPAWGGEVRAFARDPDRYLIEISSVT